MDGLAYAAAVLVNDQFLPLFILFLAFSWFALAKRQMLVLMIALLLIFAFVPFLKFAYLDARPCQLEPQSGVCPTDAGLPSAHAAVTSAFAAASLGGPWFLLFALIAAFVSYSRILLGVHSLSQVSAGIALGISLFWLAKSLYKHFIEKHKVAVKKPKRDFNFELRRQATHCAFGVFLIAIGVFLGRELLLLSILAMLAGLFLLVHLKITGMKFAPFDYVIRTFERKDIELPGRGALHYLAGSLLLVSFLHDFNFALAAIAILGIGDGLATIAGLKWGFTNRIPYNREKSFAGSAAFFIGSTLVAIPFIGLLPALAYCAVLAFIESLPLHADDNLIIPIAAVALNFFSAFV